MFKHGGDIIDTRRTANVYCMQQWTARIRDCRTSGMTITAWCKEHEINPKTYYCWQKKVRIATCEHLPAVQEGDMPIVPLTHLVCSTETEKSSYSCAQTTAVLHQGTLPWADELPDKCKKSKT